MQSQFHLFRRTRQGLAAATLALAAIGAGSAFASNIVLVHGINVDGSGWRPVHDILKDKGHQVSIVQAPLTGFADDLTATRRVLDGLDGPVVLVGHSYGGVIVTTAGNDPKVKALVYLSAFQPDAGETTGSLNTEYPPLLDTSAVGFSEDGYVTISEAGFLNDIAPDLPSETASFLFASQVPTTSDVFMAETDAPAWRQKPSFAVLSTEDRVVSPALQAMMYTRSGAEVTKVDAGHMVYMSHPEAVAEVILQAARHTE